MLRAFILIALLAAPAVAEVRVVDGDTIAIDGKRVRLFGIDASERGQPGAHDATEHLRRLVGKSRPTCEQVDYDRRNERPVSLCFVNGINLSLEMVRAGHAVVWCSFVRVLRPASFETFRAVEQRAKTERRGIWASPTAPWREWGC